MTSVSLNPQFKYHVTKVASKGISSTEMVDAYDEWGHRYSQDVLTHGYCGHVLTAKYTCASFPADQRSTVNIMDVGAGTGLVGEELKKAGFKNVDCLDPSAEMLNKAKEKDLYRNYYVEFLGDHNLDIPENTYDAIVGSGIFMEDGHVPPSALREMVRLVKPGGYIVLVSRIGLFEEGGPCHDVKQMMDTLEEQQQWRTVDSVLGPKLYLDHVSISWRYEVLV